MKSHRRGQDPKEVIRFGEEKQGLRRCLRTGEAGPSLSGGGQRHEGRSSRSSLEPRHLLVPSSCLAGPPRPHAGPWLTCSAPPWCGVMQ